MTALWSPLSDAQSFKSAWPNTEFSLTSIDLKEIMSGGPPKDGIPPVDTPQFDTIEGASTWIAPLEPVIAVKVGQVSKAYPLQIMTWHEIVNDEINGVPVSVTFCPLCNASIVFDRRLDQQTLDFGTTGLLRMSDLVMYDRQTESWWQQFTGSAIVGELTGMELNRIPSSIISFESFAEASPNGEVLNRDTGQQRPYGQNPYPGYDDINSSPFLFRGKTDSRLKPMERVLGITIAEQNKIYPFSHVEGKSIIEDKVGDVEVLIVNSGQLLSALDQREIINSKQVGQINAWQRQVEGGDKILSFRIDSGTLKDVETNSSWDALGFATEGPLKGQQLKAVDSGVHFAFAWMAFNPETSIYQTQ
ncbi:MAG: DUF3179 domain-containing protein [bacterium]